MASNAGLPPEVAAMSPLLREHMRELVESSAFKGSRRCQQFLQYVVEKSLAGQFEDLKERRLGVALFGRSPDYDTGDDAIVRVTASDVRKRLHQYYSEMESATRIELPAGSYVPEFRTLPIRETPPPPTPVRPVPARRRVLSKWALTGALAAATLAISGGWVYRGYLTREKLSARNVLPWSALFRDGRPVQLVLADPDIPAMEVLTGSRITLSDYANRRYIQNPNAYGADIQRAFTLLRGVNVAAVDVGIALEISRLATLHGAQVKTHTARSLQMSSFKTDDHFILLGSPHSNPWSELFAEHLDFEFTHDAALNLEVIRNKRVQSGEAANYAPTVGGWGTGHAFATVAVVGNPGQTGKVLLLAGTNAEGTEAAGRFVANAETLASTLQSHGIDPAGPSCDFQVLLRVSTMAGSANAVEVIACHRLGGARP